MPCRVELLREGSISKQTQRLRELFAQEGIIRLIGAHKALGAKLGELAGFEWIWASGLEVSTSYVVPDADILTMSEFLASAQSMADAVSVPVVADCDTGYGNSSNVIHMVRKFEAAGIAAVCIKDKLFPRVNSLFPGRQELAPIAEFVGKIMVAKNAQRDPNLMVIARLEALIAGWGQEEALTRAHAYREAGADAILVHSRSSSPQPIVDFVHAWDFNAPLVVVPTTYYTITTSELQELGIKATIYANHGLRAGIRAMLDTFNEILKEGSTATVEERIAPMSLVFELQGMPQMQQAEEIYLRGDMERTRAIIPAAGDHMAEHSLEHNMADTPIAMLDINGRPLLQRQVELLNRCGISSTTVVGGYKREKIEVEGIDLIDNSDWSDTGDLDSIMCAATTYEGRTLIVYADILLGADALGKLLKSQEDITLLVDRTYESRGYDSNRRPDLVVVSNPHPNSRRSLDVGASNRVVKIGKNIPLEEANGEFCGLALLSRDGCDLLRQAYRVNSEPNHRWPRS